MAKVDKKNAVEEIDDGIREKMIAVNRVTKVVKGGRILAFAALTEDHRCRRRQGLRGYGHRQEP